LQPHLVFNQRATTFVSVQQDQANNVTRIAQVMKIWENQRGVHEKFPTTSTKKISHTQHQNNSKAATKTQLKFHPFPKTSSGAFSFIIGFL